MTTAVSRPGVPRPMTPQTILASRLDQLARRSSAGRRRRSGAQMAGCASACELARGLDPYLSRWTTPESAALRQLAQRTEAEDWRRHAGDGAAAPLEQEMLSGHVEGQALKMLVHATRARRVLEIGMFTGYSALAMAEALPADGQVVACEIDAGVAAFAQAVLRGLTRTAARSRSGSAPPRTPWASWRRPASVFDLVFIDADKAGYIGYLITLLDTGWSLRTA